MNRQKRFLVFGKPTKLRGWFTLDLRGTPDIKHDLNNFPYPFKTSSIYKIKMCHVLEHLKEPKQTILEIHRILRKNGQLSITVPYGFTTQNNPSHLHNFKPNWFHEFGNSRSSFNYNVIGGKFNVRTSIKYGKFRFWKGYEIKAELRKE